MNSNTAESARIDVLDVMRGIAILLIFFFNIPNMGNSNYEHFGATRLLGWSLPDQVCWAFLHIFLEGTQRGLLEILFGAGTLILLRRTLETNGPVAPADAYFRRNFWLIALGLFDIFALLWFGDILLAYGVAALFLFPLRKLRSRYLLAIVVLFVGIVTALGGSSYRTQSSVYHSAIQAQQKLAMGGSLNAHERDVIKAQQKTMEIDHLPASVLHEERVARLGAMRGYISLFHAIWFKYLWAGGGLQEEILESFYSMLLGMALFKLGVTQGERSVRLYLWMMLAGYGLGLPVRAFGAWQHTLFAGVPDISTFMYEPARILVTLGHVSLINLFMKTKSGSALLAPFKAPGRTALSLYLMQNLLGDWVLFPAFGMGLWGRYGWIGLTVIALLVVAGQVVIANLWLQAFSMGPVEWLWRTVAYLRIQPFRRARSESDLVAL